MPSELLSLANETLQEISAHIPDRQSLGGFMNCSSRLWRIARRTLFQELQVTTRFGEQYAFARAIELFEEKDSANFTSLVRILHLRRTYAPTYIDKNTSIHIGIITALLAHTPNAHTLHVVGFNWSHPGCFLPLPSPHTGFAKNLTSLHVDTVDNTDDGPSILCLMGLGTISSLRITECRWRGSHGKHPFRDAPFIPPIVGIEGGMGPVKPLGEYTRLSGRIEHLRTLDVLGVPMNLGWLLNSIESLQDTLLTLKISFGTQRGEYYPL